MTVLRLPSLRIGCPTLGERIPTRNSVVYTPTIDLFRIVGYGVVVGGGVIGCVIVATDSVATI